VHPLCGINEAIADKIHSKELYVLFNGRIVKSGGKTLALELEEKEYDWIKAEAQAA
jgi:Fe-S cluster assembly ATP-binding protein